MESVEETLYNPLPLTRTLYSHVTSLTLTSRLAFRTNVKGRGPPSSNKCRIWQGAGLSSTKTSGHNRQHQTLFCLSDRGAGSWENKQLGEKAPTSLFAVPCGDEQWRQLVLVIGQQTGNPLHWGTHAREQGIIPGPRRWRSYHFGSSRHFRRGGGRGRDLSHCRSRLQQTEVAGSFIDVGFWLPFFFLPGDVFWKHFTLTTYICTQISVLWEYRPISAVFKNINSLWRFWLGYFSFWSSEGNRTLLLCRLTCEWISAMESLLCSFSSTEKNWTGKCNYNKNYDLLQFGCAAEKAKQLRVAKMLKHDLDATALVFFIFGKFMNKGRVYSKFIL